MAEQEEEMIQTPHDEMQIGNFDLNSPQLFRDLESIVEDNVQCQPPRQQQRKKKCRGNRREQHIRRRARRQMSGNNTMETNQGGNDASRVGMDDEPMQVSIDC